ncbi:hypothetical protein E2C01_064545 [Portunus trituberculatus]|uniref:Uncharacterized protein n=1 Tax=Portunus trituberculatus TaxID=210409 RepID=A0A5B7HC42_PORTR|nr:hypothetical protein [Portunus trituberculatus]
MIPPQHARSGVWRVLPDNLGPAHLVGCPAASCAAPSLPRGHCRAKQYKQALVSGMATPAI